MKIALIDPSLFTWPYDKALADALARQGHDVLLYTKFLGPSEQGKGNPLVCEFFYPGFQTKLMAALPRPVFLGLKGVCHFFCLLFLWAKLWLEKPDIIHFQWVPLPVVDGLFIRLYKHISPVVLTVHDSSPFNDNPRSRLQSMGAVDIMRDFDHLIVHTDKAKGALRRYGISESLASKIEHGVLGDPLPEQKDSPPKSNDRVTILLFGHLKPYKGADLLIKALSKLSPETLEKIILRIVGKAQMDTEPLFAMARDLKVEKHIEWDLRFIREEEVAPVFHQSDIIAMPYREIDASGVLMVCLSAGKPIVATRIGLFAEILEEGRHAFLVPLEDVQSLAKALETLIESPQMLQQMGLNVLELGRSIPSWDDIAVKTANLYESLNRKVA